MKSALNTLLIIGAKVLRKNDGCTGAEADKETVYQIDQGRSGTNSRQCLRTDSAADNDGIYRVIHLLKKGTHQNGEKEKQQLFPDDAFRNISRLCTLNHWYTPLLSRLILPR